MAIKLDIKTGVITIDEKYEIKPLMTIEELQNSNLVELMDDESRSSLFGKKRAIIVRTKYKEDEVFLNLECYKNLFRINITVDPSGISEAYYTGSQEELGKVVGKNSDLRLELLEEAEGEDFFNWGFVDQHGGGRESNVYISVDYIDKKPSIDSKL